jgi:hypothetical protein
MDTTDDSTIGLRSLLSEKCVILTGGRDRLNNILIQFPSDTQLEKLSNDDIQRLILYLASIPMMSSYASSRQHLTQRHTFVFVIDMRRRKYESVKPILKVLENLHENFGFKIHHVYIIKPDNFWQKQKTSFASSKYNFEVKFIKGKRLLYNSINQKLTNFSIFSFNK